MNWLITGGCGFIGTNLIHSLRNANQVHSIRVVDNLIVGSREALGKVTTFAEVSPDRLAPVGSSSNRVELVVADILDDTVAVEAVQGADVIVHLAASTGVDISVKNPRLDCVTNVVGTLNYLEAARLGGVRRFVLASSGAPVGECEPPIHEELAPHPVSPYGASKLAGEGYCSAYARSFGLETVALRFGNVYGPRSSHKGSVVAKFIRRGLSGRPLEVYGDGRQTRDFVFVEDLVRAVESAATRPGLSGELFQIATNRETTVQELVEGLLKAFDRRGLPRPNVEHRSPRVGDVHRNFSDTRKAKRVLGWTAEVSLAEGLDQTLTWFNSRQL